MVALLRWYLQNLFLCLIHLFTAVACRFSKYWTPKRTAPPYPSGARPIVGHLHLLAGNKPPQRVLGDMSDNYGPIFSLRIGFHEAIVVSSWEIAKECFTTKDKIFSTRPRSLALKLMAYDQSVIGFSPYGPDWRLMRKFVVLHLLSTHKLHMLRHVRFSEIGLFVQSLYQQWADQTGKNAKPILVEFKEKFQDLTTDIIIRIVAGNRYGEESKRLQKALARFLQLSGVFLISDAIPLLGWIDRLNGNYAKMKAVAEEIDGVLSKWLKEHKEKRRRGQIQDEENDLMHIMMSELRDGDLGTLGCEKDTLIKSISMSMILGGNDTTSLTMTWVLCFILNNRAVLRKAQEELDTHVGRHRRVEESDIKNLVYLQAVLKETMRLQPVLPLLITREAMEDCKLAGFDIPAGTHLLVNTWKMHRDPSVWSDPLEFNPDRFLNQQKHVDLKGKDFELLPFGGGRRVCPGIAFSQQVMHLTMARLLQGFELDTVDGLAVDMSEGLGLTVPKATPLQVLLIPRLSPHLYMSA